MFVRVETPVLENIPTFKVLPRPQLETTAGTGKHSHVQVLARPQVSAFNCLTLDVPSHTICNLPGKRLTG